MATWSDVQDHMRSTYRLLSDEPQALAMSWKYEDGRTQRIIVRRFIANGHDMVELKSPFAKLGGPDPLELLRENGRLPFGAVALAGEVFLVVHNADLTDLDIPRFDKLLQRVAQLADRLEDKYAKQDAF
jgi:hypothetical protein